MSKNTNDLDYSETKELISHNEELTKVAKPIKGRPRKEHNEVLYSSDVKYSTEYYRLHKTDKICCDICNKEINRFTKSTHQKSKKCLFEKYKKIIDNLKQDE